MDKKHRLPKSFGQIRYLGKGRKKPYAVHPSMANVTLSANKQAASTDAVNKKHRQTLCYVSDWETAYKVLVLYNARLYEKGIEDRLGHIPLPSDHIDTSHDRMVAYAKRIIEDFDTIRNGGELPRYEPEITTDEKQYTFAEVYEIFYQHKFGPHAQRTYDKRTKNAYNSAWIKIKSFYNKTLDEVSIDELEAAVNNVADDGYSKTTVCRTTTLIHQLYRFAYDRGYCKKEYGSHVELPGVKGEKHHQDFTDGELRKIWKGYNGLDSFVKDVCRMLLIMCYSGFRISEFETLEVVRDTRIPYFKGGLKTDAGKNRVVPIHSKILPLIDEITTDGKCAFLCGKKTQQFRRDMRQVMDAMKIDNKKKDRYHTPHSTRHTFSRLCESYGVSEADRKRMLGHSLKSDVTNGVYGHRSIAELKKEIEKIKVPMV